jgi:hypothetical protein
MANSIPSAFFQDYSSIWHLSGISRLDKILINTINHVYCIAEQDNEFKKTQQSDILYCRMAFEC